MMMREMLVPGRYIRVDSRGHWGVLQQQFAQTAAASNFPGSLAPMHLVSAPTDILAGSSGSGSGGTLGGMGSSGWQLSQRLGRRQRRRQLLRQPRVHLRRDALLSRRDANAVFQLHSWECSTCSHLYLWHTAKASIR